MKLSVKCMFAATLLAGGILFTAAVSSNPGQEFITHTVAKGETVSLLCIDYYGHYSSEMGNAFKEINPSVQNINLIHVGQKLKFANPDYKPQAKKSPSPLFEKKVSITQAVVTYVEGDARLISGSHKEKLTSNTIVNPGAIIETASNGRVEMIINKESVVRIKENTRTTLGTIRDKKKNKGTTEMNFTIGSVWTKVKKFKDKISRFQLELPTAIAGVHGTVYQATVDNDSSAEVKVYDGEVSVKNNPKTAALSPTEGFHEVSGPEEVSAPHEVSLSEWSQIIRSMQKIDIDKEGHPGKPESFSRASDDDWEQWNEKRDKRIAKMFMEI
ncbi:MAG: hypothetical protein GF401_14490 [Chitinivibrionales bacterium]|nr:hypothetical protein [Chitinivibrionales bacterium]